MREKNKNFIKQTLKPKVLKRVELEKKLENVFNTNFFIISAAMGCGKTTAVYEFLENKREYNIVWFSASMYNNDEEWAWKKFCRAVSEINQKMGNRLRNFTLPNDNEDIYAVIDILKENITEKTIIVIDDGECLKNEKIKKIFDTIAFDNIPKLYIIFITRNLPSYNYIRSEVKNQCTILWQDDFLFDKREIEELFRLNGIELKEDEIENIYNYTLGWAMPIYTILTDWNKNKCDFDFSKCVKLLKESIFDELGIQERNNLIKIGVLSEFTIEQAIYITNDKKVEKLIATLQENKLFIQYDSIQKIYKFNFIFKILLNMELIQSDILKDDIYNKCAEYYIKTDNIICAFKQWKKIEKYDNIFDYINTKCDYEIMEEDPSFIESIFKNMTLLQKQRYPLAYIKYVNFMVFSKRMLLTLEQLQEIMKIYKESAYIKDIADYYLIKGELYLTAIQIYNSNIITKVNFAKKACELLKATKSKTIKNNSPFRFGFYNILYSLHYEKGSLRKVIYEIEHKIPDFIDICNGCGAGIQYLIQAEYQYETGNIDVAEIFAYKALYTAENNNQIGIIISSYFLICRVLLNKGNYIKFNETLYILKEYKIKNDKFLNLIRDAAVVYLYGILGKQEKADLWLKERNNYENIYNSKSENMYIFIGISMIIKKKFINLEILAETMIKDFIESENIFGIIYAYIFSAIGKYNNNDIKSCKEYMIRAVETAEYDRIVMPFIDMAPHILSIVKKLRGECVFLDYIYERIVKFNNTYNKFNNIEELNNKNLELTEREIEVMECVCNGDKQTEIAAALNVSLNTIRYHLKNIYDKLGVKNKVCAIQKYNSAFK